MLCLLVLPKQVSCEGEPEWRGRLHRDDSHEPLDTRGVSSEGVRVRGGGGVWVRLGCKGEE